MDVTQRQSRDSDQFSVHSRLRVRDLGISLSFMTAGVLLYAFRMDVTESRGNLLAICAFLVGAIPLFSRRGTIVSRDGCTVCRWWGFCVPLVRRMAQIRPKAVRLNRYLMLDDSAYDNFFHTISIVSEGLPLAHVTHSADACRAHAMAVNLAEFLAVPLEDRTEEVEARMSWFGFPVWKEKPGSPRIKVHLMSRGKMKFKHAAPHCETE